MEHLKARLIKLLVDFFGDDYRRINHAIEVMQQAEISAQKYSQWDYEILMAASILHDVGIKPSEEILGYNNGKTQEEYGPPIVRQLLEQINFDKAKLEIVANIVGNHHSPSRYDYVELKILKEADRHINRRESHPVNNSN